jgi:hypothetical protein
MPYITVSASGEELDRRELTDAPIVIGRAPECQVSVHDILLSRRHCRIEPDAEHPGHWRAVDLGSRNGTLLRLNKISTHTLAEGDVLRIGRVTKVTFHAGAFVPAAPVEKKTRPAGKSARPADPVEALSGTVAGFVFCETEGEAAARGAGGKPRENGRPRDASKRPPSPRPRMSDVSPDETQAASGLNDFSPSSSGPVARTAANRLWELEEGGEARSSRSQDLERGGNGRENHDPVVHDPVSDDADGNGHHGAPHLDEACADDDAKPRPGAGIGRSLPRPIVKSPPRRAMRRSCEADLSLQATADLTHDHPPIGMPPTALSPAPDEKLMQSLGSSRQRHAAPPTSAARELKPLATGPERRPRWAVMVAVLACALTALLIGSLWIIVR